VEKCLFCGNPCRVIICTVKLHGDSKKLQQVTAITTKELQFKRIRLQYLIFYGKKGPSNA
jgi:hypothetical protein